MRDDTSGDARAINKRLTDQLVECGDRAGFTVVREYAVSGGRIDVMWLLQPSTPLPGLESAIPVVGFEIESSWRTRKHIKGDMVNLLDSGCALGVIVCAGVTPEDEALRRFARELVDRPGPTILIWDADDVWHMHAGQASTRDQLAEWQGPQNSAAGVEGHAGKYQPLWAWLQSNPAASVSVTFAELEDGIGMPLPPSCRRHVAHWSSYQGSAVARAIVDAGWKATRVDLTNQQLVLTRTA